MSPKTLSTIPTAFVFDVFGTVYDWRTTVSTQISQVLSQKLTALDAIGAHPSSVSTGASQPDLSTPDAVKSFSRSFAQEWRDSYKDFVGTNGGAGSTPKKADVDDSGNGKTATKHPAPSTPHVKEPSEELYTTVDAHHLRSLQGLLKKYSLSHLFTISEAHSLSKIWHALKPWDDSKPGVESLRKLGIVSTLSNGNMRLLVDLQKNSGVQFDVILSAQLWRSYKPDAKVYVGACEVLGVGGGEQWAEFVENNEEKGVEEGEEQWRFNERGKVAMVAAHVKDLRAAKACGLTTIYIERPKEDDDETAREKYLKDGEDWIDMWVTHGEGGILEIANRLEKLSV